MTGARLLAVLAALGVVGAITLGFVALVAPFEVDFDEGGNAMKAALVRGGAGFGAGLFSDQPPLSTWVWALLSIAGARASVLALTWLAVCALAALVAGRGASLARAGAALAVVVVALFAWPGAPRAATAMLIGLPALALATVALAVVERGDARRPVLFIGAALAAAATLTKLWAAVPLFAGVVALAVAGRATGALSLGVGAVIGAGGALAVVGPGAVSTHVAARALPDLGLSLDAALLWPLPLWLGALAALAALALRGGRDDTTRTALGLWLAVAVIAVAAHGPRWWHHGLLIAVPAAGVLALAVVRGGAARVVAVMALGAASVSVGLRPLAAPLDVVCAEEAARRLAALPAGVVVTDRPMVALRAGHVAPPGLAVVSLKRVALREVDDAALARYVVAAGGALRGVWLERFIGDAGLDATPRVAAALRGRQATVWRCPTGPGVLATLPPEP